MEIHHSKHHAAYVNNLNAALEEHPDLSGRQLEDLLQNLDRLPDDIKKAVQNNGGGHYNHSLFWNMMSPNGGGKPEGKLADAITEAFGDFASFKVEFEKAAATRFGSGWAWLCKKADGGLVVTSTANQDSPLSEGFIPILGLDVWEHAYYLKYQNKRAEYISNWWSVLNWTEVTRLYEGVRETEFAMKS
jgi:Fe-Mn family superoxide dismutase